MPAFRDQVTEEQIQVAVFVVENRRVDVHGARELTQAEQTSFVAPATGY